MADSVLDSYMRNTSDVLRMIEVCAADDLQKLSLARQASARGRVALLAYSSARWLLVVLSWPYVDSCAVDLFMPGRRIARPQAASRTLASRPIHLPTSGCALLQDRTPTSTLRVYHTTAWVARAKDSPKKHQNARLGRHGASPAAPHSNSHAMLCRPHIELFG